MRLGCLLPIVSIALVVGGGQGLYTVVTNRKPTEVTIQDFLKQAPDAKWIKVTGGELDTVNSVYNSGITKGDAKEIYVPVVPDGVDSTKEPIQLLLLTKDPELVSFINESRKLDEGTTTEEQAMEFMAKNLAKLRPARDVEGLVQFGIDSDDKKRKKIKALYNNLAEDAIILEDGKKPEAGQSAFLLLGGLGLGGFLASRSMKKSSPPPMPPAGPA